MTSCFHADRASLYRTKNVQAWFRAEDLRSLPVYATVSFSVESVKILTQNMVEDLWLSEMPIR